MKFVYLMRNIKTLIAAAVGALISLSACCQEGRINGTKIQEGNNLVGVITNSETGKGIEGVAVSDGFTITTTDKNGVYQFVGNPRCRIVYYSTPAEYKINLDEETKLPKFYKACKFNPDTLNRNDFTLTPLGRVEDEITLIVISDPQSKKDSHVERFRTESIPDIQQTINEGVEQGIYKNVYGLVLGDIVYDYLDQWDNMKDAMSNIKINDGDGYMPLFNCIGNHDHFEEESDDYLGSQNYVDRFGPTDYSFDRGNVHFVTMDNVVYLQHGKYNSGYSDAQVEWLKADFDLVKNKEEKILIFSNHIPFRNGSEKGGGNVNYDQNYDEVLTLLTQFKEVHIMIGHTHHPQKYTHHNYICKGGLPIYEHILGAVSGAWWHTNTCLDGTPNGYGIFTIKNNTLDNFVYKGTGLDESFQMRVYNGSQTYTGSKKKVFGWPEEMHGCFIADVFNDDAENWTVEFIQNGVSTPMKRVTEKMRNWCMYSYFINENERDPKNPAYHLGKLHYWTLPAPSGDPTKEKNWEIRATQTIPTSGKVNVYTVNKLHTDYSGFQNTQTKNK